MTKRIIAFILCAVLCLGLCSCKTGIEPIGNQGGTGETGVTEPAVEPAADPNVIFDNEYIKQTVVTKGFNDGSYVMGTTVENKSERPLCVEWNGCTINGWKVDFWELESVQPGDTVMVEIEIWEDELAKYGIESVEEIDFYIEITDDEDWNAIEYNEFVRYFPDGSTDYQSTAGREAKDTDIVVVDESGLLLLVDSIDAQGEDGYAIKLYLENNSDDAIMYDMTSVYADRWAMDTFGISGMLLPGAVGYDILTLNSEMMELCGVTEPAELQLEINFTEYAQYEDVVDGTFSVYPTGLTAEDVVYAERPTAGIDTVAVDNDYITIANVLAEEDFSDRLVFTCYIENKHDKDITIEIEEISWDGGLEDVFFYCEIPAGSRGYFDIDTAEIPDWKDVGEFEVKVKVREKDNYMDNLMLERVTFVAE